MNQAQKLYSAEQVAKLDEIAIKQYKIPAIELMGRAAGACFKAIRQGWPRAKRFGIFCGNGNNGGDGYALGAMLVQDNFEVEVYAVEPDKKLSPTAQIAKDEYLKTGNTILPVPNRIEHLDIIIDAMLGTGFKKPFKEIYAQVVQLINKSERPVFAIDIPSGIDGNSGAVASEVVKADLTLTFIGMKYALLTGLAKNYTGHLLFDNLGIPSEVYEAISWQGEILDLNQLLTQFKPRLPAAHKGDFGHVLVVGAGEPGYSGAVALAGLTSLSAGSGLTSAIVHPKSLHLMSKAPLEMMCHPGEQDFHPVWDKASVVVIGPGLTQADWANQQWQKALSLDKPKVVDADALHLLAQSPIKKDNWVLTPHSAEAGALLGIAVAEVEANRVASAYAIQKQYGGIVILKGAGTLVCTQESHFYLCTQGNPGMATGGMGDVLAGLVGSLIAQGLSLLEAAKLAVIIHANAGDLEQSMGERGMLASDLMLHIRTLLNPNFNTGQDHEVSQFFNL